MAFGSAIGLDRPPAFLTAEGEMSRLIGRHDWASSLGPIATWPTSLQTTVGIMLRSPVPMVLLWGPDGVMIYNDAYSAFAGGRHPTLLGSKVREGWPEVADFNDNVMRVGLAGGTLSYKDHELTLHRAGRPEQVWMNLDYSPVLDESGQPNGVIAVVVETSDRVRTDVALRESESRLRFLDGLNQAVAKLSDANEILAATTRRVGEHLGLSVCAYADMDDDEDGFTIRGDWAAPGSHSIVGHYSLADFGEMAVRNLSAGLPLVINDNLAELPPHEAKTFQDIGITATICMPLVKEGRLIALMAIHDKAPRTWSQNELALIREVTERSWAHVERVGAEAELRASEENFRTLARAMPDHVWTADPEGQLDWFNDAVYAYAGVSMGELDGSGWTRLVHPADLPAAEAAWASCLASGENYQVEFRLRRADGAWRWHIARAAPLRGEFGHVTRWIGTNTDIQAQKEAAHSLSELNAGLREREAHLQLMVLELNHRVKNNLATVQAIAVQTLRGSDDPAAARDAFQGRITALAAAHDILTREQWEGVGVAEIARGVLDALQDTGRRLELSGPKVKLGSKAALALSMAFHELGTNALKYGAFSNTDGRVGVSWKTDPAQPERLTLVWREEGGPPVEPPKARGFGSRLLERGLAAELDGDVKLEFAAEGLRCRISGLMAADL